MTGPDLTVLVVDDDYHVAHAHALSVSRISGFYVLGEAHTSAEAVALAGEATPDVVLLDMYLPDGSGLEVMRRLGDGDGRQPDVIAVTAARDIETVRAALQLGAFYYLVKPFPVGALREQLEGYRAWRERLRDSRRADQELVDELFNRRTHKPRPTPGTSLPPTMAKVLQIVEAAAQPVGASDVANTLGASRPTAQRYLASLLRRQLVDLDISYGTTGRPEHRYRVRRRSL